jgi:hypothetical protein
MEFKISGKDPVVKVLWPEESVYKLTGGFTLDKSNLKDGTDYLDKGSMLAVDFTARTATFVKTARVMEAAAADAVVYKVDKNHQFKVGDFFALVESGKAEGISAIDTSNASFDALTLDATIGAANEGDIAFEAAGQSADASAQKNMAKVMLIHDVQLQEHTTVNAAIQIFEIIEKNLPYPVAAVNKESLTTRFHFV